MTARSLVPLLTAALAAGCASPDLLALAPDDRVPLELEAPRVRLAMAPPRDARPEAERDGRAPRSERRGVPIVGRVEVQRGSEVSGDGDLGGAPLEGLDATLRRYLASIESVAVVRPREDATPATDYVLEVDVLHLVTTSFQTRRELRVPVVGWLFDPSLERRFLPTANVVLRLRLRSADGRFQAARVVNASVLGGPDEADDPAALAAAAVRAAAHEARRVTASWLARAGAAPLVVDDDAFLVHTVDVDRSGVLLARIDRRSGEVLWLERRHGLPLVGPPGVWHLAPFDERGVLLPPADYAALAEALAGGFGLQRIDQLAVYRYLGPVAR
ncbi:MAG: hypothetical protein KF878_20065 [Planctomycetes bacterium]|nr:hypothetical protein [Planctomycetota bacterium]